MSYTTSSLKINAGSTVRIRDSAATVILGKTQGKSDTAMLPRCFEQD